MTTIPSSTAYAEATPAAAERVCCDHCALPVPKSLIEPDAQHQFCCDGCASVYAIIHGRGLDRYYNMRRSVEATRAPSITQGRSADDYDAYDDPAFTAHYVTTDEAGISSATLSLEGLHCLACVWLVERLPRVVPGAIDAAVHFGRSTVLVRWDSRSASLSEVARGLHALGYPAAPPRGQSNDTERRLDARSQLIRIGVAGALAGNIMLVTIALYAGVFEGIDKTFYTFFRFISAGLGLVTLAWPGRVFFRGALAAIRTRTPHLDLPIAIALAAGGVWGVFNTVRGTGEIYFDSLAALVFLLLVGRFIQSQQQRRAADAVDLLLTITPGLVRVIDAAGQGPATTKPVEAVAIGDTAEIRAGETIPVDGLVVSGSSEIDRAILTGESAPVPVVAGSEVFAGAVNLASTLRVRVTAVGETTRAAGLMRLVADAMTSKAPIVQLADRIAGRFVVVVASLALLTGIAWAFLSPGQAIDHATALLIVTCPCALGLATPLVLSATIGRLARRGILVKGASQLERLARPGTIFLDKTGTLTTGEMTVAEQTLDAPSLRRVRALEADSTHPIARAIAASGQTEPVQAEPVQAEPVETDQVQADQVQGGGIRGTVRGVPMVVGSPAFLQDQRIEIEPAHDAWAADAASRGLTPVLVAEHGRSTGGLALSDTLRPETPALVESLLRAGWDVRVLSGDDERAVHCIARAAGIDPARAEGRVSPEGKLAAVRETIDGSPGGQHRPTVVMVGDGVNDAAALAAADVGVSVKGGADASLDAAGVSIQRGGIDAILGLIDASNAAMRRIRLCIGFSIAYNAAAASLAVVGLVHPLLAAVLMPASSLTVVALAASTARGTEQKGEPRCR